MKSSRILLIALVLLTMPFAGRAVAQNKMSSKQMFSQFQNPDNHYRPFVRWWWNGDRVKAEEQEHA